MAHDIGHSFFAIIPERTPRRYTGEALAMINSTGALGGFAGSYLVGLLSALTRGHRAGDLLMSFSLIASAFLLFLVPRSLPDSRHPRLKAF